MTDCPCCGQYKHFIKGIELAVCVRTYKKEVLQKDGVKQKRAQEIDS